MFQSMFKKNYWKPCLQYTTSFMTSSISTKPDSCISCQCYGTDDLIQLHYYHEMNFLKMKTFSEITS